jgi:hypothetical protein
LVLPLVGAREKLFILVLMNWELESLTAGGIADADY